MNRHSERAEPQPERANSDDIARSGHQTTVGPHQVESKLLRTGVRGPTMCALTHSRMMREVSAPMDAEPESGQSFDDFYATTERRVRRAIAAKHGAAYAADATAEAMEVAVRRWSRIREMQNPSGYVYRIADRAAIRAKRSIWREAPGVSGGQADPDVAAGHSADLSRALESLSGRQRAAVLLVHGWGYSYEETAELLGIRPTTLRNHLDRGMAKLRNVLLPGDDR